MPPTTRRHGRTVTGQQGTDQPRSFKERLAAAKSIAEAADDGYIEVQRDDRLDYCGFPMLISKWTVKHETETYNDKHHARVWAEVEVPDKPEPARIRFWDYGGRIGEQLLEFERCGTRGNVAVILDAREYNFDGGIGYEFFLADLPGGEPVLETAAEENANPDY